MYLCAGPVCMLCSISPNGFVICRSLASVELLMGQAYGFVSKGTLSSIYGAIIDVPKEDKAANNDPYCLNPPDAK